MKKCKCGASKWKTLRHEDGDIGSRLDFQCLRCYTVYSSKEIKRLKDAKENIKKN